ncbi:MULTISPECIES: hypothetical protein [Nocardiaceae]|uniref:hypothetical protein n=1 Tax=Nocardiaceae TaxID=85025 RepID=UPI0011A9BFDD|nr:hypothetical protein [Prescottella equi]
MIEESGRLPAEVTFRRLWVGSCVVAGIFLVAFVAATIAKGAVSPRDITANWFAAWGAWASGVTTTAAFLIAAGSLMVSSAYARLDRREAANAQEAEAMAQARLLTIYRVERPDMPASFVFFRVENRSNDRFFDVFVPYVDRIYMGEEGQLLPPDPCSNERTLEELPDGELLTPFRDHNDHEGWFTQVSVYTDDWQSVMFAVHYTDAAGRAWKQHADGRIERVEISTAVKVRKADRFQPSSQIRLLTQEESCQFEDELGVYGPSRDE